MKKKNIASNIILNIFFVVLCCLFVIPFLLLVSVSVSSESDLVNSGYALIPKTLDFSAYKYIFKNPKSVIDAYKVTIFFTVTATVLSVIIMALCAYCLSRKNFVLRKQISFYLFFSTMFSGGLVPSYILNTRYLHLNDTIWIYIIPSLVSAYYVFMFRSSFSSIPEEIFDSAKIDGTNEWRIFFQIVIPLSKPVIATVSLLIALAKWNDWNTALLYITKSELVSLQYLLQRIMNNIDLMRQNSQLISMLSDGVELPNNNLRMAMAMVCAGPMLFVFPLFQKYFVRGMTVGSVKG